MSNETEIRPALTDQEWRTARLWHAGKMIGGKVRGMVVLSLPDEQQHGAAALALYGQPFGFTRDDVTTLLDAAYYSAEGGASAATRNRLTSLIERVAALLPPE